MSKPDDSIIHSPIFLLGMPRSGTTWLSQIVESSPDCIVRLSPNYSYALKNILTTESSLEDWLRVLRIILDTDDTFMTQYWRRETGELEIFPEKSNPSKLFIKDTRFHEIYLSGMELMPDAKCVYIVRHPAATLYSWSTCKEFPPSAVFQEEWRSGECRKREGPGEYWGFDDWKTLTFKYHTLAKEKSTRYLIIRYEKLVEETLEQSKRLFDFCGLKLSRETISFIQRSHSHHNDSPYSIYKSKSVATKWRKNFPKDILQQILREIKNTHLEEYVS